MIRKINIIILGICVIFFLQCKKDFKNPYDDPSLNPPIDSNSISDLDPISFVGLHENIFKPTCANSGCHDGAFEPDFRTIESSYNTLLYQDIIKNDPSGSYEYRVMPGNATMSVLYQRLIVDIDGLSGIMPLALNPNSDWDTKKDTYINNIKDWINDGAKDPFGQTAIQGNRNPQMQGFIAYDNGGQLASRTSSKGSIIITPSNAPYEVWLSVEDDITPASDLLVKEIIFSDDQNNFTNGIKLPLNYNSNGPTEDGYFDNSISYTHYSSLPLDSFSNISQIYARVYIKDADNDTTEIPADGSLSHIKTYFSFKLP